MILEIKIKLPNGSELTLTQSEWKQLYSQLDSLFGNKYEYAKPSPLNNWPPKFIAQNNAALDSGS